MQIDDGGGRILRQIATCRTPSRRADCLRRRSTRCAAAALLRSLLGFAALLASACLAACGGARPCEYPGFNALAQRTPAPPRQLGGVPITDDEYARFRWWGEMWFRETTFGNERLMTDVIGLLNGEVEVPCEDGAGVDCYRKQPVLKFVLEAVDRLDGVAGNLHSGNAGVGGPGHTSDLVLEFPRGTRLFGGMPVPEQLHTGLDVEAGATWPIGIIPVPAPPSDAELPYLVDTVALTAESSVSAAASKPTTKLRLGVSCAICHYSLDVDMDGRADLYSAWSRPVPGSSKTGPVPGGHYRAEDTWAVGNQDLRLGWLFALSKNPLAGYLVLSGPVGDNSAATARRWAKGIQQQYRTQPQAVMRRVAEGMVAHPPGFADDTPDGRHNPTQLPTLFTHRTWPYNIEGSQVHGSDRNNSVWTTALDFSSLVAATKDRGAKTQKRIPGHTPTPYFDITAKQYAETLVHYSPAALHDRRQRAVLRDDILGTLDGVPGLLRPDSMVVITGVSGTLVPDGVVNHPHNLRHGRVRSPSDFGETGKARQNVLGATGVRVRTPPETRRRYRLDQLASERGFNLDELFTNAVSLMLDSLRPPTNHSRVLERSRSMIAHGYAVFKQAGCANCHRGPFFTDNLIHSLKEIGTRPDHTIFTRELQLGAPRYDPRTGTATRFDIGTFLEKLTQEDGTGIKTVSLRHLWGTAPYLHDGGVAVAIKAPLSADEDLVALLGRPPSHKLYGLGGILEYDRRHPDRLYRPNAALSLQAMVLAEERKRVIRANSQRTYLIPGQAAPVAMARLGITGSGHDFYIDDRPGGTKVAALVAFLLALDDNPGDVANPPFAPRCE